MYPGTTFTWHDESQITVPETDVVDNRPLFAHVSSFDRGPEDLRIVSGSDFYNLYGSKMNFSKHGQPALEAKNIIDGGGKLLIKRLVADDALLANVIFVATIKQTTVLSKSTDGTGSELSSYTSNATTVLADYIAELDGKDVTDASTVINPVTTDGGDATDTTNASTVDLDGNDEITLAASRYARLGDSTDTTNATTATLYNVDSKTYTVKWQAVSVANATSYDDVYEKAVSIYTDNETKTDTATIDPLTEGITLEQSTDYPLVIISDNGRGVSTKSVKIVPDYTTSRNMGNMLYTIYIYDKTSILNTTSATLNPRAIIGKKCYGLTEDTSVQVHFGTIDSVYDAYFAKLKDIVTVSGAAVDETTLLKYDIIFMTNNRKAALSGVSLDAESIDLGSTYGVELQNGSNGSFGDAPWADKNSTAFAKWTEKAIEIFNGTYDDAIWDLDQYKIDAVFDADYPIKLKNAIAKFVNFREDTVFFRDYGTDIESYADIYAYNDSIDSEYKTRYISDYITTYQIYDPETKKKERVTMMYDFARDCVTHFVNGAYRPLAGSVNGMYLDNAIDGTINFTPRITPNINQKSLLDDMRVNYAIFQNDRCVVQSLYTSQADYTQLSYVNNVLAIESVIHAIRKECPKARFTFATANDFSIYEDAVNTVLKPYRPDFAKLQFEYTQSAVQAAQKIFNASIRFQFNNFVQSEVFDIYALSTEDEETSTEE